MKQTNRHTKSMKGVISLMALLLFLFTEGAYGETLGDFSVSGGTYSFANNLLTITDGDVTVSTSGETSQTIKLTGGKLILNGVQISSDTSPIEVEGTAEIMLAERSTNTLKGTSEQAAGISVPPGSTLTITGKGTLTAENTITGRNTCSSCGIGGKQGSYSCGSIIFDLEGGEVMAKGGDRAAGIGTCALISMTNDVSGSILIRKGTIEATGGLYAAGIGTGPDGGSGGGVTVTIEGGDVTATAGEVGNEAGIGSGASCKTPVYVHLLGGTVTANIKPGINVSALNSVIVGPDVTVTGEITESYTNGFVFTGSPKAATVKGNSNIPAGATMEIDDGETLTVLEGTTLAIYGILVNNGTITINGSITGGGAIAGNIPNDWTGKKAYMVSYDLNGGSGTPPTGYQPEGASLAAYSSFTKEGYTCIGWNTAQDAKTALTEYTVKEGDNKLYAIWAKNLTLTSDTKEITGKVGEAFSDIKLSDLVTETTEVGVCTFVVKDGSLPTGFALAEDGTLSAASLTQAVANQQVTLAVSPKSGAKGADLTLTFNISPAELVVTPDAGQFVYKDEDANSIPIKYGYSGNLTGQTPAFTGSLVWDTGSNKIKGGTLALADNKEGNFIAANYELKVNEQVFTYYETNIAEAKATFPDDGKPNADGWNNDNVTLKAPENFKIKQIITIRKAFLATDEWKDALTIQDEGNDMEIKYQLKRDGRDAPNAEKTITLNIDKTAPTIGEAQKGNDGKSFSIEVADAVSGIASISYNLNNGGPTTATGLTAGDNSYTLTLTGLAYGTQSIKVTVTDKAGHITTATRNIDLPKPVDPTPPTPDPTPTVYYTVTLPSVEGATTDPEAGEYEVESWGSFLFRLTLDKEYDQSTPAVSTSRGETIEPSGSDGAYVIKPVRSDVDIRIDGIAKNPDPVGNETVATDAIKVWTTKGNLHIHAATGQTIQVYNLTGLLLKQADIPAGDTCWPLPAGIYIVRTATGRHKVVL